MLCHGCGSGPKLGVLRDETLQHTSGTHKSQRVRTWTSRRTGRRRTRVRGDCLATPNSTEKRNQKEEEKKSQRKETLTYKKCGC